MRELRLTTSGVVWSFQHQMRIVGSPCKLIDFFLWINDYNMNNNATTKVYTGFTSTGFTSTVYRLSTNLWFCFCFYGINHGFRLNIPHTILAHPVRLHQDVDFAREEFLNPAACTMGQSQFSGWWFFAYSSEKYESVGMVLPFPTE